MDATEDLLIFKERKERSEKKAAKAKPAKARAPKPKVDVLDELREKIEAHEREARREKAARAEKEARGRHERHEVEPGQLELTFEEPKPRLSAIAPESMMPQPEAIERPKKETKKQMIAKQEASGMTCVWHPWRKAYAVCNYCHRGFCFEDIVEEEGNYYCLEDVDKAVHFSMFRITSKAANISVAAASIFIVPLLLFIYVYNSRLAESIAYLSSTGIMQIVYSPSYQYLFPVAGIAVTFIGFLIAVATFMGSRKAIPGVLVGAIMCILFLYNYLQFNGIYDLAIGLASLASVMLFSYSKMVYLPKPQEVVEKPEAIASQWANVGRF